MVHFVGAGPGATDLITVRGQNLLKEADVIIYAGSLVNKEHLNLAKEECGIYNSASMTLEEVIDVIKTAEQEGFAALAARFRMVGAIEKMHEERYRELLRDVQAQAVFEKSSVKEWECRNCGHIVVGTSAPKVCPACHYPQGYYEVREDVRGA